MIVGNEDDVMIRGQLKMGRMNSKYIFASELKENSREDRAISGTVPYKLNTK